MGFTLPPETACFASKSPSRREFLEVGALAALGLPLTARGALVLAQSGSAAAPDWPLQFAARLEPAAVPSVFIRTLGWEPFQRQLTDAATQNLGPTAITAAVGFGQVWFHAALAPGPGVTLAAAFHDPDAFIAVAGSRQDTLVDFAVVPEAAGAGIFACWQALTPPPATRVQFASNWSDFTAQINANARSGFLLSRAQTLATGNGVGFLGLYRAMAFGASIDALLRRRDIAAKLAEYAPKVPSVLAYEPEQDLLFALFGGPAGAARFLPAASWDSLARNLRADGQAWRVASLAAIPVVPPLYRAAAPQPADVVQGELGDCYLMSSLTVLAALRPDLIQSSITRASDGTWIVAFHDGAREPVALADVAFSRENGFDLSRALWPGILLRAFSQRVLRLALQRALQPQSANPLEMASLRAVVQSDTLVLAYDRAIRASVSQNGELPADALTHQLDLTLRDLHLPDAIHQWLLAQVQQRGFFDVVAAMVNDNANCFGAYKSVGHGGSSVPVLMVWLGEAHAYRCDSVAQTGPLLAAAVRAGRAITAGTYPAEMLRPLPPHAAAEWFVPNHSYSVMGFDAAANSVHLRNPWGHHPGATGEGDLPLADFVAGFESLCISGSPLPA